MKKGFEKNKFKTRLVALAMASLLGLSACGEIVEEVPELLEPAVSTSSYRPVEIGDIGKNIIKMGSVVPTDYCYFYTASVTVSEIYVQVGDYVEEGEELALSSNDDNETRLAELTAELEYKESVHTYTEKIYNQEQKEYEYKIKACKESGDISGASEYSTEKAVEAENHRYENLLYEYQINQIEAEIEELEALKENNTLVAEQSGYITYIKDISDDTSAESLENIVIISDYDDPYIEITGEKLTTTGYSIYNIMYTVINGTRYELEEYSYTNKELAAAQNASSLPYVRFKLADGSANLLEVGNSVPLYFSTSTTSQVLIVANDSIYTEGDQSFVYVKSESSDKERRNIQVGSSDANYTEVISGLSEGELVYYDSDSVVPGNYTTYDVTLSDFSTSGSLEGDSQSAAYSVKDLDQITYTTTTSGYFAELDLAVGDEVKAGDLLFSINSGSGSAEILELESQITSEKESYNDTVADYNETISSLQSQISAYKKSSSSASLSASAVTAALFTEETPSEDTETTTEETTTEAATTTEEATTEVTTETTTEEATTEETTTVDDLIIDEDDDDENTLYMAEQLQCQVEIQKCYIQIAKLEYEQAVAELNEQLEKLQENNDGSGIISVYAEEDGIVQSLYITDTSKSYDEGAAVVAIGNAIERIITLTATPDDDTHIMVGQQITFVSAADTSETYKGTCIGTTGDTSRTYITTVDDKVYITTCSSGTDKVIIETDEDTVYDTPKAFVVRYAKVSLESIVVVPKNLIYTESDKSNGKEYNFVWRVVDGDLVKQYVTLGESSTSSYCILSGLSDGDIIAKESND